MGDQSAEDGYLETRKGIRNFIFRLAFNVLSPWDVVVLFRLGDTYGII